MLEGVQAVSRLTRQSQASGKIPLQVFDRSGGASNISWNEYQDLDPSICAELVLRAKQTNAAPPTPTQSYYGGHSSSAFNVPQPQYHLPPTPQQQQPPVIPPNSAQGHPNLPNINTQVDPANLQKILAFMNQQQSPQNPQIPPQHQQQGAQNMNPELMKILGSLQPQQQPTPAHQQGYGQPPTPQQQPMQHNQYSQIAGVLGGAQGAPPQPNPMGQPKPGQPDVQDLMAQLTRYKR